MERESPLRLLTEKMERSPFLPLVVEELLPGVNDRSHVDLDYVEKRLEYFFWSEVDSNKLPCAAVLLIERDLVDPLLNPCQLLQSRFQF